MPQLHEIQRAFKAAMFDEDAAVAQHIISDGIAATERLRIYRNTAVSVLTDALRLTFPAVDRLVGAEFFDAAAAAYIRQEPPGSAYLTRYGADFPGFLATFPPAATLRYLPDVARFEWALNVAASAPDAAPLSAAVLAAFDPEAHGLVCFVPHPSLSLVRSDYPVDTIADAVVAGDDAAMAAIDLSSGPVWLVVHRGPDGIKVLRLTESDWRLTERLCARIPLAAALGPLQAPCTTALLADHIVQGRFAGFFVTRPQMEASR